MRDFAWPLGNEISALLLNKHSFVDESIVSSVPMSLATLSARR